MNESIIDKLNKGPVDVWSIRERLALASAVLRNGNQNWVSVSRTLKPLADVERPLDWFSQINCARQYQDLLEKTAISKRKRGEKDYSETPGDVIVRKLSSERTEELRTNISDLSEKYKHLKKELELVKSETMVENLKEMWQKLQAEKASLMEARKLSEEQSLKMHSPTKDDLSTGHILELPYVQDAHVDVEHNSTMDFMLLNDDQLSQSTTSSSHENVTSCDLQNFNPCSELFYSEIKQEQVINSDPEVVEEANISDGQIIVEPTDDLAVDSDVKQEVKVEIKDEPNEDASEVKHEDNVVEENVTEPEQNLAEDDAEEQMEEEVAMETPDVEEDIVISTEEIVEDENKNVVEPSDTTQDHEMDDDEEEEEEEEASNLDAGASLLENPVEKEMVDENIGTVDEEDKEMDEEDKEMDEIEKDCPPSPVYTAAEANIEEPKTHDSVDTEPSALVESSEIKIIAQLKHNDEYLEPTSGSPDVTSKTKTPPQSKQISKSRSRRESSRRKSNALKAPKTPTIKEEGKESEISSKAGSSEEDEGKNIDEPIKTSFVRTKFDLNESLPNSPASVCNSDTEDERAHKVWKKAIMLVWRAISNHKYANIFMHPVTEDIAPGYHNVIHKPMDLNTIRKNIDLGIIRTTREFQRDMMLMFTNALMYNHSSHDVHKMARVMYQDSMAQIEQFVNTQVMMRTEPKLLRTSRRSDTGISDKEDEMRKRKASEVETTTPVQGKKRRY